jgi:GNAT superfamily N-acetyltransferase
MSEVRDVTTWYLEMRAVSQLEPARPPTEPHRIEHVRKPSAAFARYLYTAVGGDYQWTDRLPWTKAAWDAHLRRAEVSLYTLQLGGEPAGYVELEQQAATDVQLTYFGLMPEHFGRGWGGWLLTRAVQLAWQIPDTARVWVHTCTLDAPAALANYQARGFVIYHQKTQGIELGPAPGPWPGWNQGSLTSAQ